MNNTYKGAKKSWRKKFDLGKTLLEEVPSFIDPEFDNMEEGETEIVGRVRKLGKL